MFDHLAVARQGLDGLVRTDLTGLDAPGQNAAKKRIGLHRGGEQAEGAFLDFRLGHMFGDQLEQRAHVVFRAAGFSGNPAVFG